MRRALIGLALMLVPGLALADPITVTAALAPYIGGTAAAAVATAAVFVSTYGGYILAAAQVFGGIQTRRKSKKAAAAARAAYNDSLTDRTAVLLQADPPFRVVYGRAMVGGDILANFVSDKTGVRDDGSTYTRPDAYRHLIIHVATHEVQAIHDVLIDGEPVGALDGNGWATGGAFGGATRTVYQERTLAPGASATFPAAPTVIGHVHYAGGDNGATAAAYTVSGNTVTNTSGLTTQLSVSYPTQQGTVRLEFKLGTADQTASTWLQSVCPEYGANDRGRGLALVIITLDLEEPRFQGGPPQMAFDVSGRKVLDPRTSTTAWTRNPALIVRDWLTQPFGMGVDAADIDAASVIAAANVCDQTVALDVGGVVTNGPRYTADGATTTEAAPEAVLDELTDAMAGVVTQTGGAWIVQAGAYAAPVMALTDDHLHGSISIVQAGAAHGEVFNSVTARMLPEGATVVAEADPYSNAAYVAADGQELWDDIVLPWTNNRARARNLCRIRTEQGRESLVIRYPAKLHAWGLQVGDRVTVTSAEYGFSAKPFRVTDWDFGDRSPVLLTLQEDGASIYDLADAATADQEPNTGLPNPWLVPTITGLSAAGGDAQAVLVGASRLPRIRLQWDAVGSLYVQQRGAIEIEWRRAGLDEINTWRRTSATGDATGQYIEGMKAGDLIVARVRARTEVGGLGAWANVSVIVPPVTQPSLAATSLIDPSTWVVGSSGSQPGFAAIGNAGEDVIVMGDGPDGVRAPAWLSTSSEDAVGEDPDGGWNGDAYVGIDRTKPYRFSVWLRASGNMGGSFYLGPAGDFFLADPSVRIETLAGAEEGNPYFVAHPRSALVAARWYLVVGFVQPAGSTLTSGLGGVFDGVTGQKVASVPGTDYRWGPVATRTYHRAYLYYAPAGAVQALARPRLDEINGTEPSLQELLAPAIFAAVAGAQAAAQAYALAQATLAEAQANAYADGIVTAEEARAIADAQAKANAAQAAAESYAATLAGGKGASFFQATAPTATSVYDVWFKTDAGNQPYRWNGSAWVAAAFGTSALAAEAATKFHTITDDFAGASYNNGAIAQTYVFTPPVDCEIEITTVIDALGLFGDSGNLVQYRITPSGGSFTQVAAAAGWSTDRREYARIGRYVATGGVELTFEVRVNKGGGTIQLWKSEVRLMEIRR